VFFGIVSPKQAKTDNRTEQAFVSALSGCVSHELAESSTDRDKNGLYLNAMHVSRW
jgi:hypothetical protein